MKQKSMALLILILVVGCATMRQSAEPAGSVARIWHGRVPDARAEEYYAYLKSAGITKLEKIPGNLGADVLTRSRDGVTEFIVISYWRSLDDIKAYAGADIEKTHNLPRDPEFLIDMEPNVRHFTIRLSDRK
jgi:heme-degrading monooxygenase HmoA